MQPSSFNVPNQPAGTPPTPPAAPVAPATGLPPLPPVSPFAMPAPASAAPAAQTQSEIDYGAPNDASVAGAADDMPALADDGDLIEKEWVAKVKQVVRATAGDPHEQNNQFTQLRAEYMQKRYGKQIKAEE